MKAEIQQWWSHLPVKWKVWTILVAVFVPVVMAIAAHVYQVDRLQTIQQQRVQVVLALEHTRLLERLAVDIEDSFRGYLITGSAEFLLPLHEAEARLAPTIRETVQLLAGFPLLTPDIMSTSQQLKGLLTSKHEQIKQFREGRPDEVIEYVRSGQGLELSNAIRTRFRVIGDELEETVESLDGSADSVARRAFWGLLVAFLAALGLIGVGSKLLTSSITRPLSVLEEAVRRVGEASDANTLGQPIVVATADEIGQLARSFEAMAHKLKQYIGELEAINEIGHDINTIGPDGLDGVLRRIANRAAELLAVDLCMVMLRSEQMGCWIIEAASEPWHDQLRKSVLLWEELPVCAESFQAKQPVIGEGFREEGGPGARRRSFSGGIFFSLPLLSQGDPFGVLVLVQRQHIPRSGWNLRLASGFAEEAAVAISNARLYEAVQQRGKTLQVRIQELERSAETLAHDLKAPGERMVELASLLLNEYRGRMDERGLKWLTLLERNGREMMVRAERILEVARIASPGDALEPVDPRLVIDDVLKGRAGELEEKRMKVHVEPGLPIVACHRAYLYQVFDNLIANAIKFCGDRSMPAVRISAWKREGRVAFAVADNGVGIPPQHRQRVFEPFVRLDPRGTKGSGIGLAIVHRIVALYGGDVWIDSNDEGGCTVAFTVPAWAPHPLPSAFAGGLEDTAGQQGVPDVAA